jgi:hypothetical protein
MSPPRRIHRRLIIRLFFYLKNPMSLFHRSPDLCR